MMQRGKLLFALILGLGLLAAFTMVYAGTKAPDKDIVIDSKDVFAKKKKTPVTFSHEKHKEAKCDSCHHVYKDGKNAWKEGDEVQKCSACHKLQAQDKIVKLEKAYHDNCIGCHKKFKEEKKKTGPIACNKCHPGGSDKEGAEKEGADKK